MKETLSVNGMTCASCANIIERQLKKQKGIREVQASYANHSVMVEYDEKETDIARFSPLLEQLGYSIQQEHVSVADGEGDVIKGATEARRKLIVAVVFASIVMLIAMGPWHVPYAPYLMFGLSLPVLFYSGRDFFVSALRHARHFSANMDTLVALGTSVAFIYSAVLTFFPDLFEHGEKGVYYEAATMIITLILVGKYFEARAKSKTSAALHALMELGAKMATVIRNGEEVKVPIEEVKVGDRLMIKAGEKIPVDGRVIRGTSTVDESMITGESVPVSKERGNTLIGATINKSGVLTMIADKVGKDTMLSQIVGMVKQAQGSKAPVQHLADKVSGVFVPVVIVIAVLAFAVWYFLVGTSFTFALSVLVSVLIISCPCALGLATPTAVMVGVGKAASRGVLFKDAESLQRLSELDVIALDKTGTITKGQPVVTKEVWKVDLTQHEKEEVLQAVLAIESQSDHPLAYALTTYLHERELIKPEVDKIETFAGKGIAAEVSGHQYRVGNYRMLEEVGIAVSDEDLSSSGTVVLVARDGIYACGFVVEDVLKEEVKDVLDEFNASKKEVWMLTGDQEPVAKFIAGQAGIKHYKAELLPEDKLKVIEELQLQGKKVGMVGDGINDAPALAKADIGIAMGTGTDVAMQSGSVTLVHGDLQTLSDAVTISKQTMNTIKQNLFFAFFYNVIAIPVAAGILYPAFGILLSPMIAAAAMSLSSISVVTNSIRARYA
ncbi:heavy metal translocating P-type ATPase [Limibacter armeniacum]|uniref:heavy metal translocating P-type ATPase n=1 Tax=Limibacter armeniacum TaxID=466084 RepID=UPI002FE55625